MRNHKPLVISKFNGLWKRGDTEDTPLDHFSDCQNIQFFGTGFESRYGLAPYSIDPNNCGNLQNMRRAYPYIRPDRESLLALDNSGNIYDTTGPTPCTPILSIVGMTDFTFVAIAGRAYISPSNGITGLQNEFIYVYKGDGSYARKAGGDGPTGSAILIGSTLGGDVEPGYRVFGVIYETDTGFLTSPGCFNFINNFVQTYNDLSNIPISPDNFVTKRHIVATKAIKPVDWTGNLNGYEFYFVPNGTINDNTTTTIQVSFFDFDLLESADYLIDLYVHPPAVLNLSTYNSRVVGITLYGAVNSDPDLDTSFNLSLAILSYQGDPESFDQVTGLIQCPIDGHPLTNLQEYRDILYFFKQYKTFGISDNGDEPTSWGDVQIIDQGAGASVHGVMTVLDSGGVTVEYLIIVGYEGIMLFNGTYIRPELNWKIRDYWTAIDRNYIKTMQAINNTLSQLFYITLPDGYLLYADYSHGLNAKDIRFSLWKFDCEVTTIAFVNIDTLVIGALQAVP